MSLRRRPISGIPAAIRGESRDSRESVSTSNDVVAKTLKGDVKRRASSLTVRRMPSSPKRIFARPYPSHPSVLAPVVADPGALPKATSCTQPTKPIQNRPNSARPGFSNTGHSDPSRIRPGIAGNSGMVSGRTAKSARPLGSSNAVRTMSSSNAVRTVSSSNAARTVSSNTTVTGKALPTKSARTVSSSNAVTGSGMAVKSARTMSSKTAVTGKAVPTKSARTMSSNAAVAGTVIPTKSARTMCSNTAIAGTVIPTKSARTMSSSNAVNGRGMTVKSARTVDKAESVPGNCTVKSSTLSAKHVVSSKPPISAVPHKISRPTALSARPSRPTKPGTSKSGPVAEIPGDPVTRQMIDRDTLRLQSGQMFAGAIRLAPRPLPVESLDGSAISVYVRKRPIFSKETNQGEFDVISTFKNQVTVHNCLFGPDLKTPHILHVNFSGFTECFDDQHSSEYIYNQTSLPICEQVLHGGVGTVFMFGQTGSGKSFTMRDIENRVGNFFQTEKILVSFVEISGKKVTDLLHDSQPIRLRERPDGSALLENVCEQAIEGSAELESVLVAAHAKRRTESTGANDTSSRSHAVAILHIPKSGGKLMLVDLAGTERRKDSMWHDRERQRESAEINASLHALKECIRWRTTEQKTVAPFRLSSLTRILAESFINPDASVAVIATVSPNATDTEHSISTLRTVHSLLFGGTCTEVKQTQMTAPTVHRAPLSPKKWSTNEVKDWLAQWEECKLPAGTTGPMLIRMSENRFVQCCDGNQEKAARMYKSLHDLICRKGGHHS